MHTEIKKILKKPFILLQYNFYAFSVNQSGFNFYGWKSTLGYVL